MIFPLTVLAFTGVGVQYVGDIFTTTTRWPILALLAVILTVKGRVLAAFNSGFGSALIAYGIWCLLTSFWSPIPDLSLAKAGASLISIVVFVAAGRYWAQGWSDRPPIFYLLPIMLMALVAGLLGTREEQIGRGETLYYGLTGNPNYLGILAAAALPLAIFVLHRAFRDNRSPLQRIFMALLVLALGVSLWKSGSRAAFLCAMAVIGSSLLAIKPSKQIATISVLVFLATITVVLVPQIEETFYNRMIVKYATDGDILMSRRVPWEKSWQGAEAGGWTGLGYGIAYGDDSYTLQLTSIGYGREKANSQLAIVEETGLFGLIIYAILCISIARELFIGYRRAGSPEMKMQMALTSGLVVGMVTQSVFEAWWTSPGAMESSIFWSSVGVASGLAARVAATASPKVPNPRLIRPMKFPIAPRT